MANVSYVQNNFSNGEISRLISARRDTAAYRNGLRLMENQIPLPGGGSIRRPGTYYIGTSRSSNPGRLLATPRSTSYATHVCEFTSGHMRLWDARGRGLVYCSTGAVDIATSYTAALLPGLVGTPVGADLYLTTTYGKNRDGGAVQLSKFTRTPTQRQAPVANFSAREYLVANSVQCVSADATSLGIAAGMAIEFQNGTSTPYWGIVSSVPSASIIVLTTQAVPLPDPPATGTYYYKRYPARVYRAATSVDTDKLKDSGTNFTTLGVAANDVVINHKTHASALVVSVDSTTQLTLSAAIFTAVGEPYTIFSQTMNIAVVNEAVGSARDLSVAGNYPAICFSYQGRLGIGCTPNEPDMIALSRSPEAATGTYRLDDFNLGTDADHAIIVYANDNKNGGITWAAAGRRLCFGTEFGTWQGSSGLAVPDSFIPDFINANVSLRIPAVSMGQWTFYVAGPTPRVHMLVYSEEGGGMIDLDLNIAYPDLLSRGVLAMAAMQTPFPILWVLRGDGTLLSCTIDIQNGGVVPGWAKHPMTDDAPVEDICVAQEDNEETLWLMVNRPTIGRTIETLQIVMEYGDYTHQMHYVDCGKIVSQSPSATVSGLSHLEGMEVDAIADGGSMPRETVASGAVTYDRTVSIVHIGLPYTSVMQPNPPELNVGGTWIAKKKRVEEVVLMLYRTLGGSIGQSLSSLHAIPYFEPGVTLLGTAPTPFTGEVKMAVSGVVDTEGTCYLVQDQPWPFTVLAIVSRIALLET